jgi:hypothetical protein
MYHGMIGSTDNCIANSLVEPRSQQEFDFSLRLVATNIQITHLS